ncbi:MAG TPA: hypothetical protein PK109_01255, partial [Candidatus Paceibacterota bacterium]|nr:hypothetical protein [Candidatus Paceibacterota bacterium]
VALGTLARTAQKTVTIQTGEGTTTATTTQTISYTELRYVERESGNVYAYDFDKRLLSRISNRTLPGIQEASWSLDGNTAFLRFLSSNDNGGESIDTFALPVTREDGGYFLETGLDQVVVSGSSTVITLLPSSTGSIATSARIDGTNAKTFFSSALSSLRLFPAGTGVAAFTKASAQSDGVGFMVSSGGTFTRILGPLRGLTLLPSPSGKSVLYSYVSGNSVVAGMLDVATRTTTSLPIAALPEKCVWAANETAVYCGVPRSMGTGWPDSWYQGTTSFSDRIWKVDLTARTAILIVDTTAVADTAVDAVSLSIDPKSDVLLFTNKKDGSLWAYDL